MRFLFVLILLAGTGIGFIYPWAMTNFSGREIGTWRVYEQGRFKPLTVSLSSRDAPVRVLVDLTARAERIVSQQRTVLTLTAATNGRTVLASTLQFNHVDNPRQASPQLPDKIFRDDAGVIAGRQALPADHEALPAERGSEGGRAHVRDDGRVLDDRGAETRRQEPDARKPAPRRAEP